MRAIEVTQYGDPEVLTVAERRKPEPDIGEVRIDVEAAGLNYADVMQRRGEYPDGPEPPFVPGMEVAGTVDATGEGVDYDEGTRVVAMAEHGYAEYATAPVQSLIEIPEELDFAEAAGFPVQFLTAYATLHTVGDLEAGERVLVHAAAGGVGTAAVQLADHANAEVFATASTQEKLELAEELGADHTVNYTEESFADAIDDVTDGEGVDLVLDGVGGETFDESLEALAHFGRIVAYGAASGVPGTVDTTRLLFGNYDVRGFHLGNTLDRDPGRVLRSIPDLQVLLAEGEFEVVVGDRYPLEDAADAHEALQGRETVGKVVLEP